ncbi:MAG: hypothetical protein QE271_13415 [Bacteriovoracaceae bacterium]|nr:hypothetical protein [Bacteriovoracaceae bacterium]
MKLYFYLFLVGFVFVPKIFAHSSGELSSTCCFFIDGTESRSTEAKADNTYKEYRSFLNNSAVTINFGANRCEIINDRNDLPLDKILETGAYKNDFCNINSSEKGKIILVAAAHSDANDHLFLNNQSSISYIGLIDTLDSISSKYQKISTAAILDGCENFSATLQAKNTCVIANANFGLHFSHINPNYNESIKDDSMKLNWGLQPNTLNSSLLESFKSGTFLSSSISAFPWNEYVIKKDISKDLRLNYGDLFICTENNYNSWCDKDSFLNKLSQHLYKNKAYSIPKAKDYGALLYYLFSYMGLKLEEEKVIQSNFKYNRNFNIASTYKQIIWNYTLGKLGNCDDCSKFSSINLDYFQSTDNKEIKKKIKDITGKDSHLLLEYSIAINSEINATLVANQKDAPNNSSNVCKKAYFIFESFTSDLKKYFIKSKIFYDQYFYCLEYGRLLNLFPKLLPEPSNDEIIPTQKTWHDWMKKIVYNPSSDLELNNNNQLLKSAVNHLFRGEYSEISPSHFKGTFWVHNSYQNVRMDFMSITKMINDAQIRYFNDSASSDEIKKNKNYQACENIEI